MAPIPPGVAGPPYPRTVAPAYGLDIETDTAAGGLDPRRCGVLAAAVATDRRTTVLTGPEPEILRDLDRLLAQLVPGVLVTWNGSAFDLPFLADRTRICGLRTGLRLALDPGMVRSHPPLSGHAGAYRAGWYGHRHLDAYRAYRSLEAEGSCALKAVARRQGWSVPDVDPARVHELSDAELRRYVARDAELARSLARARWPEVAGFVDPAVVADPAGLADGTAAADVTDLAG